MGANLGVRCAASLPDVHAEVNDEKLGFCKLFRQDVEIEA